MFLIFNLLLYYSCASNSFSWYFHEFQHNSSSNIPISYWENSSISSVSEVDDGPYQQISLNFTFHFFGIPYKQVYISPNGALSFVSSLPSSCINQETGQYYFCGSNNYYNLLLPDLTDLNPAQSAFYALKLGPSASYLININSVSLPAGDYTISMWVYISADYDGSIIGCFATLRCPYTQYLCTSIILRDTWSYFTSKYFCDSSSFSLSFGDQNSSTSGYISISGIAIHNSQGDLIESGDLILNGNHITGYDEDGSFGNYEIYPFLRKGKVLYINSSEFFALRFDSVTLFWCFFSGYCSSIPPSIQLGSDSSRTWEVIIYPSGRITYYYSDISDPSNYPGWSNMDNTNRVWTVGMRLPFDITEYGTQINMDDWSVETAGYYLERDHIISSTLVTFCPMTTIDYNPPCLHPKIIPLNSTDVFNSINIFVSDFKCIQDYNFTCVFETQPPIYDETINLECDVFYECINESLSTVIPICEGGNWIIYNLTDCTGEWRKNIDSENCSVDSESHPILDLCCVNGSIIYYSENEIQCTSMNLQNITNDIYNNSCDGEWRNIINPNCSNDEVYCVEGYDYLQKTRYLHNESWIISTYNCIDGDILSSNYEFYPGCYPNTSCSEILYNTSFCSGNWIFDNNLNNYICLNGDVIFNETLCCEGNITYKSTIIECTGEWQYTNISLCDGILINSTTCEQNYTLSICNSLLSCSCHNVTVNPPMFESWIDYSPAFYNNTCTYPHFTCSIPQYYSSNPVMIQVSLKTNDDTFSIPRKGIKYSSMMYEYVFFNDSRFLNYEINSELDNLCESCFQFFNSFNLDNKMCVKDCSDMWDGDAFIDECGVCSGGTTGVIPNYNLDCYGECFIVDPRENIFETCLSPSFGPITGNISILIPTHATRVLCYNNHNFSCVFGDLPPVMAYWDETFSSLYCYLPSVEQIGEVNFTLLIDNSTISLKSSLKFEYLSLNTTISSETFLNYSCNHCNTDLFPLSICGIRDCTNTYQGKAFLDLCNICSEGTSNHFANTDLDCMGICFGNSYIGENGLCECIDIECKSNILPDITIFSAYTTLTLNNTTNIYSDRLYHNNLFYVSCNIDLNFEEVILPFSFIFYGHKYRRIFISPKGAIHLLSSSFPCTITYSNTTFTSEIPVFYYEECAFNQVYDTLIAVSMTDLYCSNYGFIQYNFGRSISNEQFIYIQWKNMYYTSYLNYTNTPSMTFSVYIFESGEILLEYLEILDPSLYNVHPWVIGLIAPKYLRNPLIHYPPSISLSGNYPDDWGIKNENMNIGVYPNRLDIQSNTSVLFCPIITQLCLFPQISKSSGGTPLFIGAFSTFSSSFSYFNVSFHFSHSDIIIPAIWNNSLNMFVGISIPGTTNTTTVVTLLIYNGDGFFSVNYPTFLTYLSDDDTRLNSISHHFCHSCGDFFLSLPDYIKISSYPLPSCRLDCNGNWNGDAFIDSCGICSNGSTNHLANSDKDCNDDCFGFFIENTNGECICNTTNCQRHFVRSYFSPTNPLLIEEFLLLFICTFLCFIVIITYKKYKTIQIENRKQESQLNTHDNCEKLFKEWTCSVCTYINLPESGVCELCGWVASNRFITDKDDDDIENDEDKDTWECERCTYINMPNIKACEVCGGLKGYLVFKAKQMNIGEEDIELIEDIELNNNKHESNSSVDNLNDEEEIERRHSI